MLLVNLVVETGFNVLLLFGTPLQGLLLVVEKEALKGQAPAPAMGPVGPMGPHQDHPPAVRTGPPGPAEHLLAHAVRGDPNDDVGESGRAGSKGRLDDDGPERPCQVSSKTILCRGDQKVFYMGCLGETQER